MKLLVLALVTTLGLGAAVPALADSPLPTTQPTAVATSVPVATPAVSATVPASPDSATAVPTAPITVTREHSTPVVASTQATSPDGAFGNQSSSADSGPQSVAGPTPIGNPAASSSLRSLAGPNPSFNAAGQSTSNPGITISPSAYMGAPPGVDAAPAQLACHGRNKPTSAPFLISPFSGWTEVASFFDHDKPDYEVDGKIVLANGLTSVSTNGSSSDSFPSYWSPVLRQYVNYDGHNGYDFDISYQPVMAAASGTVSFAGWNSSDPSAGYGQMILINHHNGYVTLYGHLSQIEVKKGQRVSAGQEIAVSGTTGKDRKSVV